MASRDFQATCRLAADDVHIATIDANSVALAAIQGLDQEGDERDAVIEELRRQNAMLQERIAALEEAVSALRGK